jgi:hypothetical protein
VARIHRFAVGAVVLAAGMLGNSDANAGPILTWLGFGDDPPPSYSPARFWAPGAARLKDDIHGPRIPVYAPDRHPEIPPTHAILKYPTSIALPKDTINKRPTPPATSEAR